MRQYGIEASSTWQWRGMEGSKSGLKRKATFFYEAWQKKNST